jgi:hypothetical protein
MNDARSRFVPRTAVVLDVAVVVGFAALGKRSHGDQGGIGWYGHVLWPFLVGLGVAAAVTHCYRGGGTAGDRRRRVIAAWLLTVGIALVLRSLFEGRPLVSTFVPVATAFIGLGMLGWRSVAHAVRAVRA